MQNHLVSICLPTYNRPLTLERTLHSLVNQTYPHIEIIVSDNCSPNPEVATVMSKFQQDTRIRYFRQETNKGPIFNFNFILEKVTGDFFMKMADDDWIDLNYVESCLHFLLVNPQYAAAYGAAKIYTKSGELCSSDAQIDMTEDDAIKRVVKYLKHVQYNSTYYALMRRQHLPYTFSTNIVATDWLIISRIAFSGKFKLLNTTATNISLGGDSASVENITVAYNMSRFIKNFPHLSICLNMFFDVLYRSPVYQILTTAQRFKFGWQCYGILYQKRRRAIKREIGLKNDERIKRLKKKIRYYLKAGA